MEFSWALPIVGSRNGFYKEPDPCKIYPAIDRNLTSKTHYRSEAVDHPQAEMVDPNEANEAH